MYGLESWIALGCHSRAVSAHSRMIGLFIVHLGMRLKQTALKFAVTSTDS